MTTAAIIQARMGSRRLPGKALSDVAGAPLLARVVERAHLIAGVDRVIVATGSASADDAIEGLCSSLGTDVFRGSDEDVLDRTFQAARRYGVTSIVRLTGDCPLLDPDVSGRVIARFRLGDCDYASNVHPPTFPDGLDTEVLSFSALERAWREARLPSEREHVTPYLWKHPGLFRIANVEHDHDLSSCRWTVDDPADLAFVRQVYTAASSAAGTWFGLEDVLGLLAAHPEIACVNAGQPRNAGYAASLHADHD